MFDELKKYQIKNHFSFSKDDVLGKVCNAPKDKSGIYIVFAIINETPELVYIGSSGKMRKNGSIKHRNGGLFNRIVEGKQFGKKRKLSWKNKLIEDNIKYPNGKSVKTVIAKSCIGGVKEAAETKKYFADQNVGVSLSVTPRHSG